MQNAIYAFFIGMMAQVVALPLLMVFAGLLNCCGHCCLDRLRHRAVRYVLGMAAPGQDGAREKAPNTRRKATERKAKRHRTEGERALSASALFIGRERIVA